MYNIHGNWQCQDTSTIHSDGMREETVNKTTRQREREKERERKREREIERASALAQTMYQEQLKGRIFPVIDKVRIQSHSRQSFGV